MKRMILAFIAGLLSWIVLITVLNWLLRAGLPGYTKAEPAMSFTLAMQLARLAIAAITSLAAGAIITRLSKGDLRPARTVAVLLVLLFLPVHYQVWSKFPVWYHVTFLGTLYPLVMAGARLRRARP